MQCVGMKLDWKSFVGMGSSVYFSHLEVLLPSEYYWIWFWRIGLEIIIQIFDTCDKNLEIQMDFTKCLKRTIVGNILINISRFKYFPNLPLPEIFHQNCHAAFRCCGHQLVKRFMLGNYWTQQDKEFLVKYFS